MIPPTGLGDSARPLSNYVNGWLLDYWNAIKVMCMKKVDQVLEMIVNWNGDYVWYEYLRESGIGISK